MSNFGSDQVAFFLIGGRQLVGALTKFSDKQMAILEDKTTLGTSWKAAAYVGVRGVEISQEGFYDDVADGQHAAMSTGPGISRVLCYTVEGSATGAEFVGLTGAIQVDYERQVAIEELHKAKAMYRGVGAREQGVTIRTYSPVTSTAATTGGAVDNGASNTSGGAGYVQLTSFAGATQITPRLLDSPDNITYSALVTFASTTAGAAPSAERKAIAGAIQRYVAYDASGASGSLAWAGLVRT